MKTIRVHKFLPIAPVLALLIPGLTRAADLTDVNQIVEQANLAAYYRGDDGRSEVRMTIVDAQERKRVRQFVILRKDREEGGNQDFFVLFSRPADVRMTAFLVNKQPTQEDNRWLYLPGLDLVKRISAGDKRTSFVGSHFFYEDVSGRGVDEDTHELVETTGEYYIVKSTPKNPGSVEFQYYVLSIDKSTFLPMKIEYFDKAGKNYRRVETLAVKTIQGFPTVMSGKISDLNSGGYTVTQFRNVEYNIGVPDGMFSERSLRNPPREWFVFQ